MNATAIIQVHYPEREPNLGPILDAIQEVPAIQRVIVWVNGDRYRVRFPRPTVEIIHASRNTMLGRYAAALVAPTSLIYAQDDDLVVDPHTITRLLEAAEAKPDRMVGIVGRDLAPEAAMPYTASRTVFEGSADVIGGRALAAMKSALIPGFIRSLSTNVDPHRGEDMFWSIGHAWVLSDAQWQDLPEYGTGLCTDAAHREERNDWARLVLGIHR